MNVAYSRGQFISGSEALQSAYSLIIILLFTLPFRTFGRAHAFDDLALFPNVVDELRNVRVEDLIPRGYGTLSQGAAKVVGVFDSSGTTGAPKRVVMLDDWFQRFQGYFRRWLDDAGVPRKVNWLGVLPGGQHAAGHFGPWQVNDRGGIYFTVDLDPRWVKKLVAAGRAQEVSAYADHVIEQACHVLRTQDVGLLLTTPPLLQRLATQDDLQEIINEKVHTIIWGGAHMDADTRDLLRTEIFPDVQLLGSYGTTMVLSCVWERLSASQDQCVFDTLPPYVTFRVVDPDTLQQVPYGRRGQVVTNHVSRSALLPNNLERDTAIRIQPPEGWIGDSIAEVGPVAIFDGQAVIEGVY